MSHLIRIALVAWCVLGLVMVASAQDGALVFQEFKGKSGPTLRYVLLKPAPGAKAAPLLLALPPGDQSEGMCRVVVEKYWTVLAKAGWTVVCPAAPAGRRFQAGDHDALLALAAEIAKKEHAENGLVHLAGVSNGGVSAVLLASSHADRFASLTLMPGAADKNLAVAKLKSLAKLPANLFVGEKDDQYWHAGSKAIVSAITGAGGHATLRVLPGQGHVLDLADAELIAAFDSLRPGGAKHNDEEAVAKALDSLHDAAAKADEARYFGLFVPGAIFLGTDPGERWTSEAFHDWAKPYFSSGSAWTYTPRARHIYFAPGNDVAWFDETLDNAKLGECRGSGVLVRQGGQWRIAQYNLSVPVPNDLMGSVVEMIKARPTSKP